MADRDVKERVVKAHQMGMKRYILVHGALRWGVSTALIYRILLTLTTEGLSLGKLARGFFSINTLYALVIFSIVGLMWGLFMWKWIEREVIKYNQKGKKKKK